MVSYYFDKHRSFAMGLTVMGSGVGTVFLPPILQYSIELYGWRPTFLLLGAFVLNCIACGIVLLPIKPTKVWVKKCDDIANDSGSVEMEDLENNSSSLLSTSSSSSTSTSSEESITEEDNMAAEKSKVIRFLQILRNSFDVTLFKDIPFSLFCLSSFITSLGYNAPYLYIVAWGDVELGFSAEKGFINNAAWLPSVIGVGNIVGRFLWGFLADLPQLSRMVLYIISLILCGFVTIFSTLHGSWWWMVGFAFLFGLLIGAFVSLTPLILVDLLGLDRLDVAFGILGVVQFVATLIGPQFLAVLRDKSGSFKILFWTCGGCILFSGLLLIPVYLFFNKLRPKPPRHESGRGYERLVEP